MTRGFMIVIWLGFAIMYGVMAVNTPWSADQDMRIYYSTLFMISLGVMSILIGRRK
jgi:hypothetical protein